MSPESLPEERPGERLRRFGPCALSNSELLALMLEISQERNADEVCRNILREYSVRQLSNRSMHELERISGLSRANSRRIVAWGELVRRTRREQREKLESFEEVRGAVRDMKLLESELLRAFYLDSGNHVLSTENFRGSVDSVEFSPGTIFRPGVECRCSAMVIAHNHPSGRAEPTGNDRNVTRKLIDAGNTLGIELLDHVIVGSEIRSMKKDTGLWTNQ